MEEQRPKVKVDSFSALLPYLSEDFCSHCKGLLESRLRNLDANGKYGGVSVCDSDLSETSTNFYSAESLGLSSPEKSSTFSMNRSYKQKLSLSSLVQTPERHHVQKGNSSPDSVMSKPNGLDRPEPKVAPVSKLANLSLNGGVPSDQVVEKSKNQDQIELIRMSQVGRKKDFVYIERVNGKSTNIVQGLELHTRVFNAEEQQKIVDYVYNLQRMGRSGKLRERTYTEPQKWMRGKGRITIQFGCCYNYAVDKHGNPPGIIRDEDVDPIPHLLKMMIKRLVKWHILPPTCVPNSCIVNIYDEGDCIPPHIDHHDFVRPFCTVSFLTECNILFGTSLKIAGPGEFSGPVSIPLPVGSVLILKGNGADVAKHCVPGVPGKRISITFRKMDQSKLPYNFAPDQELQGLQPLVSVPLKSSVQPSSGMHHQNQLLDDESKFVGKANNNPFNLVKNDFPSLARDDFPPLGAQSMGKSKSKK